MAKDYILQIKDLVINYGAIKACKNVNMNIEEGKITALLGANGAGKSSLIRSISGIVKVSSGDILFNGESIKNRPTYKIAHKKIIASPEGRLIFNGLTVEDNLKTGAYSLKRTKKEIVLENGEKVLKTISVKKQINDNLERVFSLFPILKTRRKQQASTLSGGEQQMLAIGRALMANPKVLLLDEPSLGLAPIVVQDIFKTLTKIKKDGTTILIVEQNAYQTLKICDYAYIMELGTIKIEGKGSDLVNDNSLVSAYLGKQN